MAPRPFKTTRTFEAPSRWMRFRAAFVGALFLASLTGLFVRAVQLQVHQRDWLSDMARDQYQRELEIPARRGDIVDRRGVALASSVEVDSVWVDPTLLVDRPAATKALARTLGLDRAELEGRLDRARRFAWVKRAVSPAEAAKVKELKLAGVGFAREPRRFYPHRELAAHVLGLVGTDGHGLDGVEHAFEDELSGEGVKRTGLRDARGRKVLTGGVVDPSAEQGASVTLTLDGQLQHVAEKALLKAVEDSKAVAGMAVVLDPKTGALLAVANAPRFNPNAPSSASPGALRNRSVTDAFEPGSTFKAFVVAAALDQGVISEQTPFDCGQGAMAIGRHVIHDTHANGACTPPKILQVSSNIGAAKVGMKLGREALSEAFAKFGFGEKPDLGLPGEARGSVPFPKAEVTLATQSFGQGLTASTVQLAAAYGALGNDGVLMKPYLVSKVVDADGVTLWENAPTPVRRVVNEKAARTVVSWLEKVVEPGGTAPKARMEAYRVSGKTGTAQKVDPVARGYGDKRIASFIGMVPAEDPRVVIAVIIDEPKTDVYGGLVAAPAFKEIATEAMAALDVPPSRDVPFAAVAAPPPPAAPFKSAVVAAIERLQDGVTEDDGSDEAPVAPGAVRVPDLKGMTARAAVAEVLTAALEPRLSGSGQVVNQAPAPGSLVEKGSRVTVTLASRLPLRP